MPVVSRRAGTLASRGQRLSGKPMTESNLSVHASRA